uniref:Uncharacterized protein n=1 Tax=Arundo donax TaxID=35708 RepID=A0A0A9FI25_ARUDO
MEEKLQEEKQLHQDLRAVRDELDNLDHQRASIERRMLSTRRKTCARNKPRSS